jgi:hypothetical protein
MIYSVPKIGERPRRPTPSISVAKAVDYIKWHADALTILNKGSSYRRTLLESDERQGHKLEQAVRDCGWCIFFQRGDKGLHDLAEEAVKKTEEIYKLDLKHMIEQAFSGIGSWLEHDAE